MGSRPLIHRGGAHLSSPPVVSHCHHGQEEGIHDPGEEEEAPYSPQEEGCRGTQEGAGEEGRGTSPSDVEPRPTLRPPPRTTSRRSASSTSTSGTAWRGRCSSCRGRSFSGTCRSTNSPSPSVT